ncbi:MAG TPA: hypothetical protein VGK48_18400 [Terriglobia bacterium]|jgi:hypothetical protein
MHISDPEEVETVLAFFRTHLGRELNLAIAVFDGLTQHERVKVTEVEAAPARIELDVVQSKRKLTIDPNQFSFSTVSPDHTRLEIGRLLGSSIMIRLTVTETT